MATGFSDNERVLGRLVMKAVEMGVPESVFGLGGMRTVGPMVQLSVEAGRCVYRVNGANGITLGPTYAIARQRVLELFKEHRAA